MKNTTKKKLTLDLTCGSDLGLWEAELMGKFFPQILVTPVVYVPNDQHVMGTL